MAELSILIKVTVVLTLALAATGLAGRQSAAVRSLVLAGTFGLLLLVPIASLMLPPQAIEMPVTYSLPFVREAVNAFAPAADSQVAIDVTPAAPSRVWMPSMRVAFLLAWAIGAIAFMTSLVVGLRRASRIRAHGRPWASVRRSVRLQADQVCSVDVVLHDEVRVPITFGVRRPVVALPADAPQWAESDLRRVLLHELEHVRRRDWLVLMVARGISALYWFHPLVWIAWRRLCLESERACDDAVLREEDGTAYAAQLLSLARRITRQDALPFLSIAGRSNLSLRIAAMLSRNVARGRVRIATAVAVAFVVAITTLAIGPLRLQRVSAQSARSGLVFEVASIRRHAPLADEAQRGIGGMRYLADRRVTGSNVDTVDLIVSAYGLYRWQLEDAPEWADSVESQGRATRFDLQATARRNASPDDMRQMLRTMLADRFGLAVHRENRVQKVYELVVAPGGHKLPAPGDRKYVPSDDVWLRVDPKTWIATMSVDQITMTQLAQNLGGPMGTLILDRTGLKGTYRVHARWSAVPGSREIFDAFPTQLGLRFREVTAPVEYLVVDRAERPRLDG